MKPSSRDGQRRSATLALESGPLGFEEQTVGGGARRPGGARQPDEFSSVRSGKGQSC